MSPHWRLGELTSCSVYEPAHLSSPNLTMKVWRIPVETLVSRLFWKVREVGCVVSERWKQQTLWQQQSRCTARQQSEGWQEQHTRFLLRILYIWNTTSGCYLLGYSLLR